MLIRSQDKKILINLDRIGAIAKSKDNHIVASESVMPRPSEILDLGQYSTEAKAIKVLGMIEDAYARHYYGQGGQSATSNTVYQPFGFIPPKVFRMPSDTEVEE